MSNKIKLEGLFKSFKFMLFYLVKILAVCYVWKLMMGWAQYPRAIYFLCSNSF